SRLADDAVYRLYKLSLSRKDTAQSDKYYQILKHLKTGDMKSELAFELAYEQFKKKNFDKSASVLSEALDTIPTADESYTKTLYWYARSLEKTTGRKNHDKAQSTYHRLITEFPYSFYAVLASHRVNSPITLPQRPIIIGEAPTENTTTFELIDAFNKKGFHQAARIVLDFALHEHPQWLLSHKEYLTLKLIESQNYRKALALASDHFKSGPYGPLTITDDPLFTAFYPLPFKSKTKIAYAKTNLPKGAIEGIMREESLFQRTVSSHAGAIGLMQLMPQTAAQVQKGLIEKGAPTTDFSSDLTDTKTNILLGATYLDQMITKFKNHLPLAIMAYNAGPGNVRKWLQRLGPLELDEFIENIPYTETQGYVKRVLRSMHVYGDLYNNTYFTKGEDINFTLPVIKPSPKKHKHHKVNKKKGKKQ
ncbi:MAG TPA: lytic transglycosylase domain-containing protein, partial [bacterium]|nr:lytic transglycosylase domain-containing protein [bacterium]